MQNRKILFVFDFDLTLSRKHTFFGFKPPGNLSDQEIHDNVKPNLAETFRAIFKSGNVAGIATRNEDVDLIHKHFVAAGLTDSEIEKIEIKSNTTEKNPGKPPLWGKPKWVCDFITQHQPDVVYYYDDEQTYLDHVINLLKAAHYSTTAKMNYVCIKDDDGEFLLKIINDLKTNLANMNTSLSSFGLLKKGQIRECVKDLNENDESDELKTKRCVSRA